MKLRFSDRLLILLECAVFIALIVCLALPYFIGSDPLRQIADGVQQAAGGGILGDLILGGIGMLCLLLAVFVIMIAFRRPKKAEKVPYVMLDSGEKGSVRVSVAAIRQLVEEAVYRFEGVSDLAVRIDAAEDTIRIDVECVVCAGAHVPSVTMSIQRTVREYVEANCGIAVKCVDVTVSAVEQTQREVVAELPHADKTSLPEGTAQGEFVPEEEERPEAQGVETAPADGEAPTAEEGAPETADAPQGEETESPEEGTGDTETDEVRRDGEV